MKVTYQLIDDTGNRLRKVLGGVVHISRVSWFTPDGDYRSPWTVWSDVDMTHYKFASFPELLQWVERLERVNQ